MSYYSRLTYVIFSLIVSLMNVSCVQLLPDCTLLLPVQPFTKLGLAEPYVLQPPCSMSNASTDAAFVHVTIVDLDSGALSVYNPLVVDAIYANYTHTLSVQPVQPELPLRYTAAIWFGFNGNNLTLANKNINGPGGIQNANCVNGGGVNRECNFGQYAYCNAPIFYSTLNNMIAQNMINVPELGIAVDGKTCPTVRDWSVVDQTPSDNVPVSYLSINLPNGQPQTIQDTLANREAYPGYSVIDSSSDNDLLNSYISPALGCSSSIWKVRNLAESNSSAANYMVTSVALNEIQAAMYQPLPMARVPSNDTMTFNDAPYLPLGKRMDVEKLNNYRVSVNQVVVMSLDDASTTSYCINLLKYGVPRIYNNRQIFQQISNNVWNSNLYDYLIARLNSTIAELPYGLGCIDSILPNIGLAPISNGLYASSDIGEQNIPLTYNLSATASALRHWYETVLLPASENLPDAPIGRFDNIREGVSYVVINGSTFNWSVQSFFIGFCVMLFISLCVALTVYLCIKHKVHSNSNSSTFAGLTPSQSPIPLLKPNGATVELESNTYNSA